MARRSFTAIDVTEILVHWYAGRPKTELAASLGVDRKTVRKYLAPAEAAGFVPGGPPVPTAARRVVSGSARAGRIPPTDLAQDTRGVSQGTGQTRPDGHVVTS